METYVDRMKQEHADLSEKLERLESFIKDGFKGAPTLSEQYRLKKQASLMRQYRDVLAERIEFARG